MSLRSALRRGWLLWLLIGVVLAGAIFWFEASGESGSRIVLARSKDSTGCVRPQLSLGEAVESSHMPSVRNISDPGALNYCRPSDPRWGVLGRFPGDTTITLEQGRTRVSARLIGRPGETLVVMWAGEPYPVVAVYGGGVGWKQRYITVRSDLHYVLPIQWDEHHNAWEAYGLDRWTDESGPRTPGEESSLEGRCTHCHEDDARRLSGSPFIGTEEAF